MIGAMDPIPASVLVIDSHPLMRAALCNAIEAEVDFSVLSPGKQEGRENLVAFQLEPDVILVPHIPDLVVVTLNPCGHVDSRTLKSLRGYLPRTPILALTSNEVAGEEKAAREAGASMTLSKAASRTEFIRRLREQWRKAILDYSSIELNQEVVAEKDTYLHSTSIQTH